MLIDLCLSLGVMFVFARAGGWLARKMDLPEISGEILAGILLGPTVLGHFQPEIARSFFELSPEAAEVQQTLIKIGVFIFIFLAGTEISLGSVRERLSSVLRLTLGGLLLPLTLGILWAFWMPEFWKVHTQLTIPQFALFLGAALSISALPVIARIFIHLKLIRTPIASAVMTAAAFEDMIGWTLFSLILILTRFQLHLQEFLPLLCFWTGVFASGQLAKNEKLRKFLFLLTLKITAPIYFVSIGMKTNFLSEFSFSLTALVFLAACLGKIGGVSLGAWWGGFPRAEIWAAAFSMNARGAMEIFLAALALEAGLIEAPLFTALVVMAVGTSILAALMLRNLKNLSGAIQPDREGVQ